MPEFIAEPANSNDAHVFSGDCYYPATTGIPEAQVSTDLILFMGRDNSKTPRNLGTAMIYDTTEIPLGAKLLRSRLEVVPTRSHNITTDAFTLSIDVLGPTTRTDNVFTQVHECQLRYGPSSTLFSFTSMWADQNVGGGDSLFVPRPVALGNGLGALAQAWVANVSADIVYHAFRLKRTGTDATATVRVDLYTAAGSDGNYTKGTLITAGVSRTFNSIGTAWTTEGFLLGSVTAITSGTRYIAELVVQQTSGGSGLLDVSYGFEPNDAVDNTSLYGFDDGTSGAPTDREMQGFDGRVQWLDGNHIKDFAKTGTTDAIAAPTFTLNTVHSFGNGGSPTYSPNTTLTNFLANIQEAMDARTTRTRWIGIRMQDFAGVTANKFREIHSHRDRTQITRGALYGPVLTLDWVGVRDPIQAFGSVARRR